MPDRSFPRQAHSERRLRFGVWIPACLGWSVIQKRVHMIEELGFDSIWIADLFTRPLETQSHALQAWSVLAGIAGCTHRIRLGTMMTTAVRHEPARLARMAMMINSISHGRLTFGLVAGLKAVLTGDKTGEPAWEDQTMVGRFEEDVQTIIRVLGGKETLFDTKYKQKEGAVLPPGCIQRPRPPMLISAESRPMIGIAGRYADTWNVLGKADCSQAEFVSHTAEAIQSLTVSALLAGRDPDSVRRSLCLGWTREEIYSGLAVFRDHVYPFIELGFTQFMLGYWQETELDWAAPIKSVPDDETLIWMAKVVIPSLRSLAQVK